MDYRFIISVSDVLIFSRIVPILDTLNVHKMCFLDQEQLQLSEVFAEFLQLFWLGQYHTQACSGVTTGKPIRLDALDVLVKAGDPIKCTGACQARHELL